MYSWEYLSLDPTEFASMREVPGFPSKKPLVLIIEDDPMAKMRLSRVLKLRDDDMNVFHVESVDEAKVLLRGSNTFNLIICDQFLPGTDTGLALWRYCKTNYPNIPFLMTSGEDIVSFFEKGDGQKAPPFLRKPFSNVEALNQLEILVPDRPQETDVLTGTHFILTILTFLSLMAYGTLFYQGRITTKPDLMQKVEKQIPPIRVKELLVTPPTTPQLHKTQSETIYSMTR